MDYVETAIAEAVAASDAQEAEAKTEEVTTEQKTTEPEGQPEEAQKTDSEEEANQEEAFPKKAVNALARKDKKLTKLSAERDLWRQKATELEARLNSPAPQEQDFEGKPYGEFLNAAAKHAAQLALTEQALEAAKQETSEIESELDQSGRAALDESGANAEKTFPDFRQVIESHATHVRADGQKVLPLSNNARDALQRSDDGAAAIYAILKDGALNQLNSLPPMEAAMMVKEYEYKAQSLPKIKHVSSAPEPITSARGVASGSKSIENMSAKELLALTRN